MASRSSFKKDYKAENTAVFLRENTNKVVVFSLLLLAVIAVAGVLIGLKSRATAQASAMYVTAGAQNDYAAVAADFSGTVFGDFAQLKEAKRLFDAGDFEKSKTAFEQFANQGSNDFLRARSLAGVAYCLEQMEQYEKAAQAFAKAAEAEKNATWKQDNIIGVARCTELQGQLPQALEMYQKFLSDHPDSVWIQGIQTRINFLKRKI